MAGGLVLGCGEYVAGVRARGGGDWLSPDARWTEVSWSRSLSDTGEASMRVDPAWWGCRDLLANANPWEHELVLRRDGVTVWEGPIVAKPARRALSARDLSTWLDRRMIRSTLEFRQVDVATIVQALVAEAMRPDPSPKLGVLASEVGILADRSYRAGKHVMVGDEVRELARTGCDWTVTGRVLFVRQPRTRYRVDERLPVIRDEHLATLPDVTVDGVLMVTSQGVRGFDSRLSETADDPVYGLATNAEAIARYGLIDGLVTEDSIRDAGSAAAAAASRLGVVSAPISTIGSLQLAATAPVTIDELVPGNLIRVELDGADQPIRETRRIVSVSVSRSPASEDVTVETHPVGVLTDA